MNKKHPADARCFFDALQGEEAINCQYQLTAHVLLPGESLVDGKVVKDLPEYKLGNTEDFEGLKENNLKAAKTLENTGKDGIIKVAKASKKDRDVLDLASGIRYRVAKGTKVQNREVFAGKGSSKPYRNAEKYANRYGGNVEDWQHVKGIMILETEDGDQRAEIHWSECQGIGIVDRFIKRWLE